VILFDSWQDEAPIADLEPIEAAIHSWHHRHTLPDFLNIHDQEEDFEEQDLTGYNLGGKEEKKSEMVIPKEEEEKKSEMVIPKEEEENKSEMVLPKEETEEKSKIKGLERTEGAVATEPRTEEAVSTGSRLRYQEGDGISVKFSGLLSSEMIITATTQARKLIDEGKVEWVGLMIWGYRNVPISFGKAEHDALWSGENDYILIITKKNNYVLYVALGQLDQYS